MDKRRGSRAPGLLIRNLAFTVLVPGMVAGVVPYLIATSSPDRLRFDPGLARLAGLVLIALGAAIYLWCLTDFIRAQGTPAPIDPPKEVVARGLYRVIRNPMYVGVLSMVLGEAITVGAGLVAIYAGVLMAVFHLFVVGYEEPTLRKQFGDAYEHYCRDVPRWIPHQKPRA
jgi:protein-S-isoprenylcysteine O-methyltransferase Ste14